MNGPITDLAERRYLTDPEFHVKVDQAVDAIQYERGVRFDALDRSLATLAAAVALLIPDSPSGLDRAYW